jgi:hypothetical protein
MIIYLFAITLISVWDKDESRKLELAAFCHKGISYDMTL